MKPRVSLSSGEVELLLEALSELRSVVMNVCPEREAVRYKDCLAKDERIQDLSGRLAAASFRSAMRAAGEVMPPAVARFVRSLER